MQFSGFVAWIAWLLIHVVRLIDFENRITVLFNWAITFFSNRPNRVITPQQVFGRLAMEAELGAERVKKTVFDQVAPEMSGK